MIISGDSAAVIYVLKNMEGGYKGSKTYRDTTKVHAL